jgi:hypothetical protein|eukprot:CAMPEP_0174351490 /NCGR_PEP_ID=MMETSP0811_2-20130205/8869_1 /TAXON_ID=73025 ORGANISM="Eutreptiella gymnastica-like, Strain CCMP1594" /NCGR_SAMPLE_ID=MMETSP0811_2 /ASSEMBLY_ACC=CAM_ASM_000667 /LENGTH=73 /DNA_ID=CAMNT_0015480769 /DNA_START=46 /DNA_END=267 /DNA_ORIENTATION=-
MTDFLGKDGPMCPKHLHTHVRVFGKTPYEHSGVWGGLGHVRSGSRRTASKWIRYGSQYKTSPKVDDPRMIPAT